jgi:16S rRNA processing protein RimM
MPAEWDDLAVVGRVARPHGTRGQVIVNVDTDFPRERFHPGAQLLVRRTVDIEPLTLTSVRFHRDRPIIGIAGIDTIEAAAGLAGLELRIPVDRLVKLPSGTFYRHDLVGCRVETPAGSAVGVVRAVEGAGAGSRLVVAADRGEILIPLAWEICTTIDPEAKRIVVDAPEGLLDLNR